MSNHTRDYEKMINDLIDRATHESTNVDEARNCAMQAVRLIRKHKFRVTQRAELPGIDIPATKVWDETVELAKQDAKERLENLADTLFGGIFNPAEFLREETSHGNYIQGKAPNRMVCHSCNAEIKHGSPILQEFGANAQRGTRRVTCLKDRCRASWGRIK